MSNIDKQTVNFQIGITFVQGNKHTYLKNKEPAREAIAKKVQFFNSLYRFEINRIAIRNQSTRWGSCSRRKNLNFNFRLIYLPNEIANYIIVHEICHLKEFNHSKSFWELVERTIPNYKELRKKLKTYRF